MYQKQSANFYFQMKLFFENYRRTLTSFSVHVRKKNAKLELSFKTSNGLLSSLKRENRPGWYQVMEAWMVAFDIIAHGQSEQLSVCYERFFRIISWLFYLL